jgi:hypothetical protein
MEAVYFGKCCCIEEGNVCPERKFIVNDIINQRVVGITVCAEYFRLIMKNDVFNPKLSNLFINNYDNTVRYIIEKVGIKCNYSHYFFAISRGKNIRIEDFYISYFVTKKPNIIAKVRIDEAIKLITERNNTELIIEIDDYLEEGIVSFLHKVKDSSRLKKISKECDLLCRAIKNRCRLNDDLVFRVNSILISHLNNLKS